MAKANAAGASGRGANLSGRPILAGLVLSPPVDEVMLRLDHAQLPVDVSLR
jgi:hypothetical protein